MKEFSRRTCDPCEPSEDSRTRPIQFPNGPSGNWLRTVWTLLHPGEAACAWINSHRVPCLVMVVGVMAAVGAKPPGADGRTKSRHGGVPGQPDPGLSTVLRTRPQGLLVMQPWPNRITG